MSDEMYRNDDFDDEDIEQLGLNTNVDNQYVVFNVENEEFALPILSVQEIISYQEVTKLPGMPDFIAGIVNIRGTVIPLYIMRRKFGLTDAELTKLTTIIIVKIGKEDSEKLIGLIVDGVSDVVNIAEENFSPAPEFNETVDVRFIRSIGKLNNRMIALINMETFLSDKETSALENMQKLV